MTISGSIGCAASPDSADDGAWDFELATLYWAVGIEGDASIGTGGGSASASLDDPLAFEKGIILRTEIGSDPWALMADGMYVDYAGSTGNLGPLTTEVGVEAAIVKVAVARTLASWPIAEDTGRIDLQAYAGARYAHLELVLDGQAGGRRDARADWVDPFVGLRSRASIGEHFGVELAGDIGGFGVSSDLVWSLLARVDWNPYPGFGVFAGYNILDYDFDEGPGSDTIGHDVRLSGPVLGITIRF